MASASFEDVGSLLDEFSDQVAGLSAVSVNREADELGRVLSFGVALAITIDVVDANWRLAVLTETEGYDPAREDEILDYTREWMRGANQVAAQLDRLEAGGAAVRWSQQFRRAYREARGVLAPDEAFFTSDVMAEMRDAAIDAHREGRTDEFDALGK